MFSNNNGSSFSLLGRWWENEANPTFSTHDPDARIEWFRSPEDARAKLAVLVLSDARWAKDLKVVTEEDLIQHKQKSCLEEWELAERGYYIEGYPPPTLDDWEAGGRRCYKCGGRMSGMACNDCGHDVS